MEVAAAFRTERSLRNRVKRFCVLRPVTTAGSARRLKPRAACADQERQMQIGDPIRTYTVEPLEDPVPREVSAEPVEDPVEVPSEPEHVAS